MEIYTYDSGETSVIEIRNKVFDISNYSVMSHQLLDILASSGRARLVLDISRIKAVDSVGIGLLAKVREAARKQGVNVAVACTDINIWKILELLNMTKTINAHGSVVEAIKHTK